MEHVYLIQLGMNVALKNNIYKIGRTSKGMQRFNSYDNGYIIYLFEKCNDSKKIEKK